MRKQKVVYLVIPFKHQPVWIFSFRCLLENNKSPLGWPLYVSLLFYSALTPHYTEWISILCCLRYSLNPSQLYTGRNAHSSQLLLTSVSLKILCGNKFHIIMWHQSLTVISHNVNTLIKLLRKTFLQKMAKAPYESCILWSRFLLINYLNLRNQPFAFSR